MLKCIVLYDAGLVLEAVHPAEPKDLMPPFLSMEELMLQALVETLTVCLPLSTLAGLVSARRSPGSGGRRVRGASP